MNEVEMSLKRPFPVNKIKWRPGGGGKDLCYIDARDVMDRLDQVFGIFGWQTNYEFMGGRMICNLSVRFDGDYESGKSEWIIKSDGSDDTNIEGEKGGISGALKRSAVLLGIGRYLYNSNAFNSNREPASWATPEGFDELMEKRNVG